MVANPDGSGRTPLFPGDHLGQAYLYDFGRLASPTGGWLAVYTYEDRDRQSGPTLQLVHVPDGLVPWSTPLLSNDLEAAFAGGTDAEAMTAYEAVTLAGAAAWAPDGRSLAFVAALDGTSSDLYLYDLATSRVRRVTSGPNQIATPFWSPDGKWIAHQAVEGFGTGAGWQMGSVWTVSPDGRDLNKLYAPESGGEVFVGWSRGDSLISYSFSPDGLHNIRAAGADGAVENILVPSTFSDVAYDPESGSVAYAVSGDLEFTGSETGAFLWNPVGGTDRIDPGSWDAVHWSPAAGRFYFEGEAGVLGVTPAGDSLQLPVVDRVSPSPDGRYVVLWGDGFWNRQSGMQLYTSDMQFVRTLDEFDVPVVSWRPDSAGLMAMSEAGLTYYPLDGQPLVVDPSATASFEGGLGWVMP